jgi:DNA-binding CsgD family transcriptional regulator
MENKIVLTPLEIEMLLRVERGVRNKDLAEIPGHVCSLPSVSHRLKVLRVKLGVSTKEQAVTRAKELGLLDEQPQQQ